MLVVIVVSNVPFFPISKISFHLWEISFPVLYSFHALGAAVHWFSFCEIDLSPKCRIRAEIARQGILWVKRKILLIFQRNIPKKRIFGRVCIDGGGVVGFKLEGGKPENFRNWSSFELKRRISRYLFRPEIPNVMNTICRWSPYVNSCVVSFSMSYNFLGPISLEIQF